MAFNEWADSTSSRIAVTAGSLLLSFLSIHVQSRRAAQVLQLDVPLRSASAASSSDKAADFNFDRWVMRRSLLNFQNLLGGFMFVPLAVMSDASTLPWRAIQLLFFPVFVSALGSCSNNLQLLRGLDALPIARTRLFRYFTLPSIVWTIASIVIIGAHAGGDRSIKLGGNDQYASVQVPYEMWVVTTEPDAPIVELPGGETFQPTSHRLSKLPIWVFNPYETGVSSSIEMIEHQVRRALHDGGFGSSYEERLVGTCSAHGTHPELLDEFLLKRGMNPAAVAAPFLALAWFLGLINVVFASDWRRLHPKQRWLPRLIAPHLAWVLLTPLILAFATTFTSEPVLGVAFSRVEALLGGQEAAGFAVGAAVMLLGYWVLQARFAQLEAPPPLKGVLKDRRFMEA